MRFHIVFLLVLSFVVFGGCDEKKKKPANNNTNNINNTNNLNNLNNVNNANNLNNTNNQQPVQLEFDFSASGEGFVPIYADYPEGEEEFYELESGWEPLPGMLPGERSGVYISGNNHSDDLFMLLARKIEHAQITSGTQWSLTASVEIATSAGSGCVGVGGAPGESVFFKAGAVGFTPESAPVENFMTMNLDKGNQSGGGEDMYVIGDLANGTDDCMGETWAFKTMNLQDFAVTAGDDGELWILFGTDSGFEATSRWYLTHVELTLTPIP